MSEYVVEVEYDTFNGTFSQKRGKEIVRCRDCRHFASDELGDCCTLLDFEDVKSMDNGFCAWGERRDA